jgi:hypothetical protein
MSTTVEKVRNAAEEIAQVAGKKVQEGETFASKAEAEKHLEKKGYIYGFTQCASPIGFALAQNCSRVEKWRNIAREEYKNLDGVLIHHEPYDYQDTHVTAFYFE